MRQFHQNYSPASGKVLSSLKQLIFSKICKKCRNVEQALTEFNQIVKKYLKKKAPVYILKILGI